LTAETEGVQAAEGIHRKNHLPDCLNAGLMLLFSYNTDMLVLEGGMP